MKKIQPGGASAAGTLGVPPGVNQIGDEMQKKTQRYVNKFNVFEQDDTIKRIRQ